MHDAGEERGGAKTASLMDTLSRDAKDCRTSGCAGVNLGTLVLFELGLGFVATPFVVLEIFERFLR